MMIQQAHSSFLNAMQFVFGEKRIKGKIVKAERGFRNFEYLVRLGNPLNLNQVLALDENFALAANCEGVITQRKQGLVSLQFGIPTQLYKTLTRTEISGLELGLTDSKQGVELPEDSHVLIAGCTRSGKSFNAFNIALNFCNEFDESQLNLFVIDPHRQWEIYKSKDGTQEFETFKGSSHVKAFAHSQEEIESLVQWLTDEMELRLESGKSQPKLVLIVDEGDRVCTLTPSIENNLTRLAKESAKQNMMLIVLSQNPSVDTIPFRNQLTISLVGKLNMRKADITNFLGQSVNARILTLGGDSLFCDGTDIQRYLVPHLAPKDFKSIPKGDGLIELVQPKKIEVLPEVNPRGRVSQAHDMELLAYCTRFGTRNMGINKIAEAFSTSNHTVEKHLRDAQEFIKFYNQLRRVS